MVGVSDVALAIAQVAPGSATSGVTVHENVSGSPSGSVAEPLRAIDAPSAPDAGSTVTVGGTLFGRTAAVYTSNIDRAPFGLSPVLFEESAHDGYSTPSANARPVKSPSSCRPLKL